MIVVRVELHSAVTGQVTTLYNAIIANDSTGDAMSGNYDAVAGHKGDTDLRHIWTTSRRRSKIEHYPRQAKHVLNLVARALNAMGFK